MEQQGQTQLELQLELQQLVELLGSRDWRAVNATWEALVATGDRGLGAVVAGLAHPEARIRRGCADFLDHYGTDACVPALRDTALHDPVAGVRRAAVHALLCQRCKPCALTSDLMDFLVQVALEDSSARVRGEAIWGLGAQPRDPRAIAALKRILRQESRPDLLRGAHDALMRQDPAYREAMQLHARLRGIVQAQSRSVAGATPAPATPM